jgi:hypothetical protein
MNVGGVNRTAQQSDPSIRPMNTMAGFPASAVFQSILASEHGVLR